MYSFNQKGGMDLNLSFHNFKNSGRRSSFSKMIHQTHFLAGAVSDQYQLHLYLASPEKELELFTIITVKNFK